ncbi:MAG: hypothetical protein ABSB15_27520 [Bryobacteraceae bacterium]|jgi:hypothetical protein
MSENMQSLVREHQAFYEVTPYYVVVEERKPDLPPVTRQVQRGFDVDIYGVNTNNQLEVPGSDPDYASGCAELQKLADEASLLISDRCMLEVIPSSSTAILDFRNHAVEATIRIRIHHYRGLDQPFGPPEQRALEDIVKRLGDLGIARR